MPEVPALAHKVLVLRAMKRTMKRTMKHTMTVLAASGLLAVALAPRAASAGCPSSFEGGCDMATAAQVTFSPDPGCLTVTSHENDCTCSGSLTITNGCTEPLQAVDFEWCEYAYETGCPTVIEPGRAQELFLPRPGAEALAEQSVELPLKLGESDLTMRVEYEMVHVEHDVGCSAAPGTSAPPALGWLGLALTLTGLLARRRR